MAIKPCKECGSPVSDKAPTCPQCGAKQPKKTSKLALILAGLVLLVIFGSLLSGGDEKASDENENSNVRQKWFVETETDPMTDKKRVYVSVVANNVLMKGNDWSTLQEPIMTFRCQDDSTEVLVDFKQPLSPEYGNALRRTTKFRLDDEKPFNVTLDTAQGNLRVYFVSDPVRNLKKMIGHQKLLISYQAHRTGEQVLEFDITELETRLKPIRELCNW
ncbi:type VI secretion system-associated protein TagO [uncultured Acinetobacter sp.]|uniref:type VI secretion system-associated protein TagO n=1 Tax=uncultured Acinetobacter sp. TaxID=165433 RepID=UPI00261F4A90|nr:type VI secretion system-associated protein TagO [uncultured Acinetobacter sp.]